MFVDTQVITKNRKAETANQGKSTKILILKINFGNDKAQCVADDYVIPPEFL